MTSALFLSTDTLDKPSEGYAAHRKTPPSTDSLTQRSYLTHNKTAAIPNGTAAATVVRREAPNAPPGQTPSKTREAHLILFTPNPRRPRTKGPDGLPSECIPQHEALFKRAERANIPPAVIRRRPDIAGPATSLLLGTLRRTQEALAARSAQRGLLACPRTCLKVN